MEHRELQSFCAIPNMPLYIFQLFLPQQLFSPIWATVYNNNPMNGPLWQILCLKNIKSGEQGVVGIVWEKEPVSLQLVVSSPFRVSFSSLQG